MTSNDLCVMQQPRTHFFIIYNEYVKRNEAEKGGNVQFVVSLFGYLLIFQYFCCEIVHNPSKLLT